MQPATGAKDLNPQQVEINQFISLKLTAVFKLWGYEQVSPPNIELLETLKAGGAISNDDILKIVSGEQLGLRPEMTASLSRTAATRLVNRPRPLRLSSSGTIFKCKSTKGANTSIEEKQQAGVELFGVEKISAEIELLSLILESLNALNLKRDLNPTLLIGHTDLMQLILSKFSLDSKEEIKTVLINFDKIGIENLNISDNEKMQLTKLNLCRGLPNYVLKNLQELYGDVKILSSLKRLFEIIEPISNKYNVRIQLDPTFRPHFELYNGLVFQLVCSGQKSHSIIARGGRYDKIVKQFNPNIDKGFGVGLSFDIDEIRELIDDNINKINDKEKYLIAYSKNIEIEKALDIQKNLHDKGKVALLELEPCLNKESAMKLLKKRKCTLLRWLD